jgi:nucleoside-diphosphate-sugar epimerase
MSMSDTGLRCAVTGASGYLGSRASQLLSARGWAVFPLSRRSSLAPGDHQEVVPFSLEQGAPEGFFREQKIDLLVHCAYDFGQTGWADIRRLNVEGSVRLLRQARAEGVRTIIFISTMSAFEGCRSLYGKAKLAVEREALWLGAHVIRPGLIYGPSPGAMVGALTKAVRATPVVPLIGNGKQVLYLAHEDDLASLIHKLGSHPDLKFDGPLIAASERGLTFRAILERLATLNQRKIRLVPVPWQLLWGGLKAAEILGLKIRLRSDSLISLLYQDPSPQFDESRKAGIHFRDFMSFKLDGAP